MYDRQWSETAVVPIGTDQFAVSSIGEINFLVNDERHRRNLQMAIRLVASDIDGTLLQNGAVQLENDIFDEIRRLRDRGIQFCPASGRQYHSLRKLFEPVADDVVFLCENGALAFQNGRVLFKRAMDHDLCRDLVHDILSIEGCEVLISGENISYLMPRGDQIVDLIKNFTGNNVRIVRSFDEIPEEIVKVSAFHPDGTELPVKMLQDPWARRFRAAVAGREWYDFTLADKGTGIAEVCRSLGISLSETAAFGDNYNDVPMLDSVGLPYIMDGAADELKEKYSHHAQNVPDTLRKIIP